MTFDFFAQLQGLRDDPIPPFSGTGGGIGIGAVVQMLVALAIVLALVKWIVPKYLAKLAKKPTTALGSELNVAESAAVAGGHILLVSARGRTLLVGASQNGFTTLADLTEEHAEPNDKSEFGRVLERLKKLEG